MKSVESDLISLKRNDDRHPSSSSFIVDLLPSTTMTTKTTTAKFPQQHSHRHIRTAISYSSSRYIHFMSNINQQNTYKQVNVNLFYPSLHDHTHRQTYTQHKDQQLLFKMVLFSKGSTRINGFKNGHRLQMDLSHRCWILK